MRRLKFYVQGAWEERLLAQWLVVIMTGVHLCLGVGIVVGGIERFSTPTYQPLVDMADGRIWIWGLATIVAGALIMTPFKWPSVLGLWLGMAWMIMWTSLFSVSLVQYPSAAATPAVAYGGFALIDAALLTARLMERRGE